MATDRTTRQNRVREALGRIYEQQPPYFREYLRRYQEDPTSRVFAPLAEAYRRLGRVDEAIEICLEGLEHHPDFHGGRVALAKCYVDRKKYPEARVELERVLKSVPENLLAQRLLGDVLTVLRDRRGALHCYKMALLLSPSDVGLAEKVHNFEQTLEHDGLYTENEPEPISTSSSDEDEIPPFWEDRQPSAAPPASVSASRPPAAPIPAPPAMPIPSAPNAAPDPKDDLELVAFADASFVEETSGSDEPSAVDDLLGVSQSEPLEEAFKIEHVSAIFAEEPQDKKKEITTETLGDLYFSQGQFDRALRIYEKLDPSRPAPELTKKINACRARLGVQRDALVRARQVELLKSLLRKVNDDSGATSQTGKNRVRT